MEHLLWETCCKGKKVSYLFITEVEHLLWQACISKQGSEQYWTPHMESGHTLFYFKLNMYNSMFLNTDTRMKKTFFLKGFLKPRFKLGAAYYDSKTTVSTRFAILSVFLHLRMLGP